MIELLSNLCMPETLDQIPKEFYSWRQGLFFGLIFIVASSIMILSYFIVKDNSPVSDNTPDDPEEAEDREIMFNEARRALIDILGSRLLSVRRKQLRSRWTLADPSPDLQFGLIHNDDLNHH